MRILYLGSEIGTSLDRANAYRRMGHEVMHIDLRLLMFRTPWVDRLVWKMGGAWISAALAGPLQARLEAQRFDLCHVDNGEYVSQGLLKIVRLHCAALVCYCIDDPFSLRDCRRFSAFRAAVSAYDLVVVVRSPNVAEAKLLGARHVLQVRMTADEVSHEPSMMSSVEREYWASEVLFVGTWMPERGPFLAQLLCFGVPLTIRGSRWQLAPEWPALASAYRGPGALGRDYSMAIQSSKVTLGLLSKGNRDLHTTRSSEVPALGGLLCAERTEDHLAMYVEGEQAVFWSDARECADVCMALLRDPARRSTLAAAGQARARSSGYFNEPMLTKLLDELKHLQLLAAET